MECRLLSNGDLEHVKKIYLEAFPKKERKPYCMLKHAVKKHRAAVYIAMDEDKVVGFLACYSLNDLIYVDCPLKISSIK